VYRSSDFGEKKMKMKFLGERLPLKREATHSNKKDKTAQRAD